MKFSVELKLERANAENLIRAFFQDFNSKSTLQIKGDNAKAEIFFEENPPMKIVEAISHCSVLSFCYGESGDIYEPETVNTEKEESDAEEVTECKTGSIPKHSIRRAYYERTQSIAKSEMVSSKPAVVTPIVNFQKRVNEETCETHKQEESKQPNSNVKHSEQTQTSDVVKETVLDSYTDEIPELTSIASKATNYEAFLDDVFDWLEIGAEESDGMRKQRREAFLSIEKAVSDGCIRWKQIEERAVYNTRDRIVLYGAVSRKMQECGKDEIKFLNFLKILASYRNYHFKENVMTTVDDNEKNVTNPKEIVTIYPSNVGTDESNAILEGTGTSEGSTGEPEIIMPCLAEITWFVDFLKSIDKTKTIEEKVEEVLVKMNLQEPKYEDVKKEILDIAIKAMKAQSIEDIFEFKLLKSRMDFSSFLNDFVGKYLTKKVKLKDFLYDLRAVLVLS